MKNLRDSYPEDDSFVVLSEEAGIRLDQLLTKRYPSFSRTYFQGLIEKQLVLVNGELVKKRTLLQEGDEIEVEFALPPEIDLTPEPIPLHILYEDEEMLAIDKPAGLVVHPGAGNLHHTFVNGLLYHCRELRPDGTLRPGIVHRLDKETSGVLLAAKTERAQQALVALFARRAVHKEYLAICIGNPGNRLICEPIGRHPTRRKEMAVVAGGKEAETRCEVVRAYKELTLVRLFPKTGRTHQLRVHLQWAGTPILGDGLYGKVALNRRWNVTRQFLHAERVRLPHPLTGEPLEIEASLPEDMRSFLNSLSD